MARELGEGDFDAFLKENRLVLVDFWAAWCGPCRMLAPTIDKVAEEFKGRVEVVKVNVDDAPDIARKFNVMSIPTLVFFENGEVKDKFIGALASDALKAFIEKNIQ